jgi:hypothetical protein
MGLDPGPLCVGETALENGVFYRSKHHCREGSEPVFTRRLARFSRKRPLLFGIISFSDRL